MKLTIVGSGYVGLVTGTCFASLGNDVICLDIDEDKIKKLKSGRLPIYEPGLEDMFKRNITQARLTFTTDAKSAIEKSQIIMLAVPTPPNKFHEADLSAVKSVAAEIGKHMNDYKVIVNKSTVPVGTASMVRKIIKENQKAKIDFDVVSNPEFLREGAAVKDFQNPDRIIIGTNSNRARQMMNELYSPLARIDRPIVNTDIRSAEIIKYASNAMLATRISFMNQLSHLCEKTGADIKEVAKGLGLDTRIGSRFLQAGIGYGGSCFPKDVKALSATLKEHDCDSSLFDAVDDINERQKSVVVNKLKEHMNIDGATVGIWGISFKPKTDDTREAPALVIMNKLKELGAKVKAYDPVAKVKMEDIEFCDNPYDVADGADAVILVTEWDVFRSLDFGRVKSVMKGNIMIDGRNIYNPDEMKKHGFKYMGIGR